MNYIFWGFFFIILDFNITSGYTIIGLLPTFVGYILLLKGLRIIEKLSPRFAKVQSLTIVMAVYTGILYLGNLMGMSGQMYGLSLLLVLASIIVGLYIQFNIAMGIKDIEMTHSVILNADTLILLWKFVALGTALSYIGLFIPPFGVLTIILAVVANLIFLYYLYQSKKAFDRLYLL